MNSYTFEVVHVSGVLVPLTFQASDDRVDLMVNKRQIASVDRMVLQRWLARTGSRPPLVDLPLRMTVTERGVWLVVYHHVNLSLVTPYRVACLRAFLRDDDSTAQTDSARDG